MILSVAAKASVHAPWYLYGGFFLFVLAMLLVDVKFFHDEKREPSLKQALSWVAVWVALGLLFGAGLLAWKGGTPGAQYFAGYLIEYSLSVDNMFVFVVIFTYFHVPRAHQHRVLFVGILGAIVFRGVFIVAGVTLVEKFEWLIYAFGAFLLFTAVRLWRGVGETHPENNPILKFLQRRVRTTTKYAGQKLFVVEQGKRLATPLFVVMMFVNVTDVLFAVDSIPAVLAISRDPFIVLTSNIFAILGLRALYFVLAGAMDRFHLLRYGLALILAFVGGKMIVEAFHLFVPIWASLAVIIVILATTALLSLKIPPKNAA